MAITSTLTGNVFFTKPTRILVTPFEKDEDGVLAKGTTSYALDNVEADSTSITQDDEERNEIACETRDENIYESITLGKYQFSCNNADWQEALIVNVLGFTKDGDSFYAPSSYVEKFAEIEIQFGDANDLTTYRGSAVLPKVLLSSKATMESLKSNLGMMTVSGTAYSQEFTATGGKKIISPYYISTKPVTTAAS